MKNKMTNYVISRHEGAIKWIEQRVLVHHVCPHFGAEEMEKVKQGDKIFGTLPLPLIDKILKKGAEFYLLSLPDIAFSERGTELSPEEMKEAGAKLVRVRHLKLEEVVL